MPQIFINYRQADEHSLVSSILYDRIIKELNCDVFLDKSEIGVGDFIHVEINLNLDQSKILIVLIGSRWLSILKERETDQKKDWVRWEIAEAIRNNKTIIPILINDTQKPQKEDLP